MKKRKWMIAVCLVFCLVAVGTVYTQPWTIEEQYHALDLSKCTKVEGIWAYSGERLKVGERQNFELNPGDENFDKPVLLDDGSSVEGSLLNIYNFYGQITVRGLPGDDVAMCKAADHEVWLAEVFELISAQEG